MPDFSKIPWIAEHIKLYQTDPEKAQTWDSSVIGGPGPLPTLLLTTTGRKSGQPRPAPLIYGEAGDSYVIIASKGGLPTHPVWYLNLEANPNCELMVGPKSVSARARVAEGEEREHLWLAVTAAAIGAFGVTASLLYSARTVEEGILWQRVMFLTSCPLLVGFLRFSFAFLDVERPLVAHAGLAFTASVTLIAGGSDLVFTGQAVERHVPLFGMHWTESAMSPLGRAVMGS